MLYASLFLSVTCSVCVAIWMCVSGLTTWYPTTSGVLFPGEAPPQPSSVLCGPSCRVETSWASPSSLACVLMSPLFSLSGSHSCETVGLASDVPRKHNLTANSMILCLQLSRPLFCRVPRALGEGVFCRGICWGCGSQLPLDWLWIFCGGLSLLQRSLCDEVWRPHLPVGIRTSVYSSTLGIVLV